MQNTSNNCGEDYTFKSYYFATPPSDEFDGPTLNIPDSPKRRRSNDSNHSIDAFFEGSKHCKKQKKTSSLVGQASPSGGMSYITTSVDDGAQATHLMKIEIYDLNKLAMLPTNLHWKNADLRLKYYARAGTNKQYKKAKDLIYHITKEIAESKDAKKFYFNDDKNN